MSKFFKHYGIVVIVILMLPITNCTYSKSTEVKVDMTKLNQKLSKVVFASFNDNVLYTDSSGKSILKFKIPASNLEYQNDILKVSFYYNKNQNQLNFIVPVQRLEDNNYTFLNSDSSDHKALNMAVEDFGFRLVFSGNSYLKSYNTFINNLVSITQNGNQLNSSKDSVHFYQRYFNMLKIFISETQRSQMGGYTLIAFRQWIGNLAQNNKSFTALEKQVDSIACSSDERLYRETCNLKEFGLIKKVSCLDYPIDTLVLQSSTSFIHPDVIKDKVLVVDFWATWCVPCIKEMYQLDSLGKAKYNHTPVEFICVSIDQSAKSSYLFQQKHDLKSLIFYYDDGCMKRNYNVQYIPQNFIFDKKRKLRYKNLHGKQLQEKIDELLKE